MRELTHKLGYGILGVKKCAIWEIGGNKSWVWDIEFPVSPPDHLCKGVINIIDNYGIKQLNNGTTFGI